VSQPLTAAPVTTMLASDAASAASARSVPNAAQTPTSSAPTGPASRGSGWGSEASRKVVAARPTSIPAPTAARVSRAPSTKVASPASASSAARPPATMAMTSKSAPTSRASGASSLAGPSLMMVRAMGSTSERSSSEPGGSGSSPSSVGRSKASTMGASTSARSGTSRTRSEPGSRARASLGERVTGAASGLEGERAGVVSGREARGEGLVTSFAGVSTSTMRRGDFFGSGVAGEIEDAGVGAGTARGISKPGLPSGSKSPSRRGSGAAPPGCPRYVQRQVVGLQK
jgi:hypothetical protein